MRADASTVRSSLRNAIRFTAARGNPTSKPVVRLSQLCKLRECEQVAAVCYRWREDIIEFLLVRTRGSGRWTFPKGGAEPGLTHAQAAALEAFEEAGVHGRIEEAAFARYVCRKRVDTRKSAARSAENELTVNAHLCQVLRLTKPKEAKRNRTWLSAKDARRCLREGRETGDGAEFVRVVDKAVSRILRLHSSAEIVADPPMQERKNDALQKVQFEAVAADLAMARGARFVPYRSQRFAEWNSVSPGFNPESRKILPCEVLEFNLAGQKKPPALGSGARQR